MANTAPDDSELEQLLTQLLRQLSPAFIADNTGTRPGLVGRQAGGMPSAASDRSMQNGAKVGSAELAGGAAPGSAKAGGGDLAAGAARGGSAEPGRAELGSVELGGVEPGSAEPGSVELGGVELGSAEQAGSAEPGVSEPGVSVPDNAAPGHAAVLGGVAADSADLAVGAEQGSRASSGGAEQVNVASAGGADLGSGDLGGGFPGDPSASGVAGPNGALQPDGVAPAPGAADSPETGGINAAGLEATEAARPAVTDVPAPDAGDALGPDGLVVSGTPSAGVPVPAMSASEARALIELVSARGIAQGELAAVLRLDKSTVSRLAAGLERKGWVRRGRDEANQRYVRLYLTPEGAQMANRVWQAWQSRQARILAALSSDERAGLIAGLGGLVRGLAAEAAGAPRDA